MGGSQRTRITHIPARPGLLQDAVRQGGALIVWCRDAATDEVIASGSPTYHVRFLDTPQPSIVGKPAGSILTLDVERRSGRVVIVDVH